MRTIEIEVIPGEAARWVRRNLPRPYYTEQRINFDLLDETRLGFEPPATCTVTGCERAPIAIYMMRCTEGRESADATLNTTTRIETPVAFCEPHRDELVKSEGAEVGDE